MPAQLSFEPSEPTDPTEGTEANPGNPALVLQDEADIGDGDKNAGQQETEALIELIGERVPVLEHAERDTPKLPLNESLHETPPPMLP